MSNRPTPRLYLSIPLVGGATPVDGLVPMLTAMLGASDVAAVLLHLPEADDRSLINQIKLLAPVIQKRGAALLLDGHADIAVKAGADGAHLSDPDEFQAALAMLKPDRIVGCGGLTTRHDAMTAAELGADYVMFGETDADRQRPSFDAVLERVAWWAEVFEVPCIGYAGCANEIEPIAAAGADFVAVGDWIFSSARGPVQAITWAAARLALVETDTRVEI